MKDSVPPWLLSTLKTLTTFGGYPANGPTNFREMGDNSECSIGRMVLAAHIWGKRGGYRGTGNSGSSRYLELHAGDPVTFTE